VLDAAIAEWNAGRYYEAHEILEDVAEQFEADDPAFEWALALTRVAACLHKLRAGVGVRAVPAKLATALETLRDAPNDWLGIDLARLRSDLDALATRIRSDAPPPPELPRIFVR
jgi:hypothetical protein